ncbi:hypothetical protein BAY61_05755 [Prauserella marina]|uniref:Uncharacterized protein n=1 Tax=Prauserella marina TaxID=530584 RepID=A0A222VLD2_9PSEU|nr:hypothetical protein [Prauserella marina]ASR34573.1 hypothetical protein BAY61_05755 [Prauserella marina]PWV85804.1 hypothetical protein DES30_1011834 [Prauserella marina]SDC45097.1 hypothetical protein SAMN05421630_102158 [Prauserella marina]
MAGNNNRVRYVVFGSGESWCIRHPALAAAAARCRRFAEAVQAVAPVEDGRQARRRAGTRPWPLTLIADTDDTDPASFYHYGDRLAATVPCIEAAIEAVEADIDRLREPGAFARFARELDQARADLCQLQWVLDQTRRFVAGLDLIGDRLDELGFAAARRYVEVAESAEQAVTTIHTMPRHTPPWHAAACALGEAIAAFDRVAATVDDELADIEAATDRLVAAPVLPA